MHHRVSLSIGLVSLAACSGGGGGGGGDGGSGVVLAPGGDRPLAAMVATVFTGSPVAFTSGNTPADLAGYVRELLAELNADGTWAQTNGVEFPLANTTTDTVRTITGTEHHVVVRWLDPLRPGMSDVPEQRFGANGDYIAYFGDGWDADWVGGAIGSPPQFHGDPTAGFVWSNHETMSNAEPRIGVAPTGQHLTLATFLQDAGVLAFDVTIAANWDQAAIDVYTPWYKRQLGGSWVSIRQDPVDLRWSVQLENANRRFDGTSETLVRVVGLPLENAQTNDAGGVLAPDVVPGIMADCSGCLTPWGTVITAEENVQGFYGDAEPWWNGRRLTLGAGADPGADITPAIAPSTSADFGRTSSAFERHDRDGYGYLVEMDPDRAPSVAFQPSGNGTGHRKLGVMGRLRWENATVVTDTDFELISGRPIVLYGGNDRLGGRVYKFVSATNYTAGMTRAEVRDLLNDGTLFVAHFADLNHRTGTTLENGTQNGVSLLDTDGIAATRGNGQWLEMSLAGTDIAPNAGATVMTSNSTVSLLGAGATVGQALADPDHNGLGSFASEDDVLKLLYTAANKIGVMELNRPEDVEWAPNGYASHGPLLFVAATQHNATRALDRFGVLNTYVSDPDGGGPIDAGDHVDTLSRTDVTGSIFAVRETGGEPHASTSFEFWIVKRGTQGNGPLDVARPDNLLLDAQGGLWFCTDGNFSGNGTADALYYLDLDPAHVATASSTFGDAFRILAVPGDAEATGPAFNSDMTTLFTSIQHPGAGQASSWPLDR